MIKFSPRIERVLRERINAIFTLVATLLFCMKELLVENQDFNYLAFKIIGVILLFWYVLGRIFSKILYLLLKEIIEDQIEVEEDKARRTELHEFENLEKAETRENIQKVKF